ncbi:MAG: hypothetical protein ACI8UO_004590 [Verrucomicrobiales bacterium]|jgi:hypothetical protein
MDTWREPDKFGVTRKTMTREEATAKIQDACKEIALQMMKVQPTIRHLGHEETEADCVRAAYQLTIELEIIKKKLIRLQNRGEGDGSVV